MVNNVNKILRNIAKEHKVPIFNTIEDAVNYCNKKLDNTFSNNNKINYKNSLKQKKTKKNLKLNIKKSLKK